MRNPLHQLGTDMIYIFKSLNFRVLITGTIMLFAFCYAGLFVYEYLNKKLWTNVDHMIEKRVDDMVDHNPVTIHIGVIPDSEE